MSQGQKISQYGADQSPVTTDYVLGNKASGPSTVTFKLSDLITLFAANFANSSLNTQMLYNPYKFSVYLNNAQTLTAATWTKVNFDTETFDTGSNFDSSTNHRFTAPVDGYYQFDAAALVGATGISGSAYATAAIYVNGSSVSRGIQIQGSGTSNVLPVIHMSAFLKLSANDYVELYAYVSESSRQVGNGLSNTYLHGFLVSAT